LYEKCHKVLGEFEEFAEALLDQISVETNEENEIASLASRIAEDPEFKVKFESPQQIAEQVLSNLKQKITEFTGMEILPGIKIEYPGLEALKTLKAKKVYATPSSEEFVKSLFSALARQDRDAIATLAKEDTTKFLVYSTYAKAYISKISTTYGDYVDSTIFLNNFILSSYAQIILYKQGKPYESRQQIVKSGHRGAIKMTILEELIHSIQKNLYDQNKKAVTEVNTINEDLAKTIQNLDDSTVTRLSEYLQMPSVPDEFPVARRANLFFMLNPDNFVVSVLGPDVMTFTKVEVDPGISKLVPNLLDIYQRWLGPIQRHHAAFSTMEGMAEFCVQNILKDDADFGQYLATYMGSDISSYQVRKHMGKDLVQAVFDRMGKAAFQTLMQNPPTTRQLKEPQLYLKDLK
jgi:hypothetical protein